MQNAKKQNKKGIIVSLLFTESTTSLLNLNIPRLEDLSPDELSKIRLPSTSGTENCPEIPQITLVRSRENNPSTSNQCAAPKTENISSKIASDVAIFSLSTCSSKSSNLEDLPEDDSAENLHVLPCSIGIPVLFESKRICNRPLFCVRTMAHTDKLNVDANEILVSLLDSDSTSSSTDLICRICHGGESLDDLLTPCRCRGTIALVHLKCLERWLKESSHSYCELCQHHYKIVREPKYSVLKSVFVFLRHPGEHLREILLDLVAFLLYTPSAVASTYMLMMMCESLLKNNVISSGSLSSHLVAFSAVFGMAAIDFTYSSWLMICLGKHIDAWREWYRSNSTLKVVLPNVKRRPKKKKKKKQTTNNTDN